MSKRREGREAAIQLLFSHDFLKPEEDFDWEQFWEMRRAEPGIKKHAEALLLGVKTHLAEIDQRITATLENFSFQRLANVDRNILRVAVFEMFHTTDIPPVVSINEAIEIAKRFGGEDSARFVNGVLDKLKEQLTRPLR